MYTVDVKTTTKTYQVDIAQHMFRQMGKNIETYAPATTYLIVTDTEVAKRYLQTLKDTFSPESRVLTFVVPAGEQSKSFAQYEAILTDAFSNQLDRASVIVAFGGGVVGDLAGFVAGTYMRGIRFVQVPTTLLAHDASVGGKVAINLPTGKNIVGVFHQPEAVLFDPGLLRSLPDKEWRSGFAEIVKLGFIADRDFYNRLCTHVTARVSLSEAAQMEMIASAIRIKAAIVAEDEREHGIRAYLNFGHTVGHALEAELGYGVLTHGEAVAVGMRIALSVSEELGGGQLPIGSFTSWFTKLGYDLTLPADIDVDRLLQRMHADKKATEGHLVMVLLSAVGEAYTTEVDPTVVRKHIAAARKEV
ncbi:3-dehydroquinate synthase [Bacillus sp. FSL W7-1360]